MKTILFVYPTIFNPRVGGVERVTDILAKRLGVLGYKVYYLHHKCDTGLLEYESPAPICFFPNSDYHSEENVFFYHLFLKEHKVDIVINQCGLFEDSLLYLNVGDNKCKTISVLHGTPMLNYEHLASEVLVLKENTLIGYLKLIARFFLYPKIKSSYLSSRIHHFNFLFSNSDMVCLLSESYIKDFEVYCKSFDRSKIISISNPNSFVPLQCKKKKQLLYVGRLDGGQKRPDRLLKIWKSLYKKFPDWEMIIVGDGKERRRLEESAKNLERISFVGFQSPEQYYHEASIFCMTSNFEGFPMVLPEAMSFGVVPFSFNSYSAIHDIIVDGKTGVLVKPFSTKEYVAKLALLMSDEDKRILMSENCMKDVTRFSLDNIVNQWITLFNSLQE
jgi:glycosyltransferase involved in cell wall biosynthesis